MASRAMSLTLSLALALGTHTVVSQASELRGPLPDGAHAKIEHIITSAIANLEDSVAKDMTEGEFCRKERKAVKEKLEEQSEVVREKMAELEAAHHEDLKATRKQEGKEVTKAEEESADRAQNRDTKSAVKAAKEVQVVNGWFTTAAERRGEMPEESLVQKPKDSAEAHAVPPAVVNVVNIMNQVAANIATEHTASILAHSNQEQKLRIARIASASAAKSDPPHMLSAEPEQRDYTETEKKVNEAKYELKEEMRTLKNYERERELLRDRCVTPKGTRSYADRVEQRQGEINGLTEAWTKLNEWKPAAR